MLIRFQKIRNWYSAISQIRVLLCFLWRLQSTLFFSNW
ncbi:hypothetical protein C5167_047488 [Papaver somniferum]|uniref:Uncharacterized protein n=1 Tax=Papaver somniferum TaxID=3469 RepID=A0A4Y7LKK7_PAPSO|nr:hypothetical protein C5167_047488 [Papaver somniferum]